MAHCLVFALESHDEEIFKHVLRFLRLLEIYRLLRSVRFWKIYRFGKIFEDLNDLWEIQVIFERHRWKSASFFRGYFRDFFRFFKGFLRFGENLWDFWRFLGSEDFLEYFRKILEPGYQADFAKQPSVLSVWTFWTVWTNNGKVLYILANKDHISKHMSFQLCFAKSNPCKISWFSKTKQWKKFQTSPKNRTRFWK